MRVVSLGVCLLVLLSYGVVAQESDTMEAWVENQLHIKVPKIGITWESISPSLAYNWSLRWRDIRFQLRDRNDNLYRLYYQGDKLYLDYKREFDLR